MIITKKFKIELNPLSTYHESQQNISEMKEDDIDYAEKMSFALMKIFSNDDGHKEIKLFLNKKIEFIVFHCMLVFHPSSSGNMYHSVEILKTLLKYYPLQLYQLFSRPNYGVIQELFKYALMSRIHDAKFGEFLLLLLLYDKSDKQNIANCRSVLISNLLKWGFLENIMQIGTNPSIYGEDISNKYCGVIATLLKQCATMQETAPLFNGSDKNMLAMIIEQFIKGGLDKNKNDKWYRIHCIKMAIQTITDLCGKKVVERKNQRKKIIKESDNYLYQSFDDGLKKVGEYVPLIVNEIVNMDSSDNVGYRSRVNKPFGLYRLQCLKLLMLYIDLSLKRKIKFEQLGINNLNDLCKALIEMALIHINNNLFLVQFRKFISTLDKYAIDTLRFMMIDCEMLKRFITFYNRDNIPSALKSFIVTILWDINENSKKGDNKSWNFFSFVESDNTTKTFMNNIVAKEIQLQQTKKN